MLLLLSSGRLGQQLAHPVSPFGGLMRLPLSILLCCLAVPISALKPAKQDSSPQQDASGLNGLVGAWRLVSVETTRPNGEVIYPFYGKHPEGLLIYDRSGWMSVQIVSDPKPTVPSSGSREGFLAATPAEKTAAIDGYYSYFGTWTVDPSGSTVTHHIQQSLYPGERGEDFVRELSFDGDRLTLI